MTKEATQNSSILKLTLTFVPFVIVTIALDKPFMTFIMVISWIFSIMFYLIARWWYGV